MGAHSTLNITKSKAKEEIVKRILSDSMTISQLESIMDRLLDDRLYNCTIVPDWCGENDDNRL